ncbi:MAG TPA: ABC transporter ATP-binding protein [Myxococcota bacterium]|nr:ABC transporter ATP-binding protein [Myxococcota bacterium]
MSAAGPAIRAKGVCKRFGARVAVRELDFEVPQGVCFGLLGPNGAGKTTALRMVYGVTKPSAGTVEVFGIDVARSPRAVRARLGVTLQDNVQIEALSPRDNLRIFARHHLLTGAARERRVEELLDFLELRSHADVPVVALSGGYKRRLAIAMSLIHDPELLVLDEPTTGLDPAVRLALWARVRELRARGRTVLLTTHYMDEAERLCDRVLILAEGRAICEGAPRALIAERLAREALEVDCTTAEEAHWLAGETWQRLRSGPRLVVYGDSVAPLIARIRAQDGGDGRPLVVRPANLEDVFLAATGTSLGGDA